MPRSLALALVALFALPAVACDDGTNDFDCETTWLSRKDEVLEKGKLEYLALPGEQAAMTRCKADMLKNVPKGGKRAECKCVGRKAVH